MDLLEHKPYARPEDVLTRAMTSCAKHRALIPPGAPLAAYDGLHSTNHYSTTAATQKTAAGAAVAEPMELGMFDPGAEDDIETTLAALDYQEAPAEKDIWEDPASQTILTLVSNKEPRACY